MSGFGTVVTGTLVGGALQQGAELALLPAGRRVRIRGLQQHNRPVEEARPGSRTAVNLSGLDHSEVRRGDVLALPGTLPSILVGSAVGMGITWEVVVAAEMISGGGSQIGGTSGGGLGFFIWNSYVGGSYEQIVVGMISIGIAGWISSAIIRRVGVLVTPWIRVR